MELYQEDILLVNIGKINNDMKDLQTNVELREIKKIVMLDNWNKASARISQPTLVKLLQVWIGNSQNNSI